MSTLNAWFPLWAVLASFFAYLQPQLVVGFKDWIVPTLVLIMFFMGITLRIADFKRILKQPKVVALAVLLQFLLMPLVALVISKILHFSLDLTVGMILVGAVAGGTASNVICYLAKADVALSITMTAVSTLLSIVITPLLTLVYAGASVSVPALDMLLNIFQIVFLPVAAGVILNRFFSSLVESLKEVLAFFSMVAIIFIIAIIVALNAQRISTIGIGLLAGVVLHNLSGISVGYWLAKFLGYDKKTCKTVAIEVGMQNSGLAVALALKYFAPLSALPGAIFSIWHNISGSILASLWSKQEKE